MLPPERLADLPGLSVPASLASSILSSATTSARGPAVPFDSQRQLQTAADCTRSIASPRWPSRRNRPRKRRAARLRSRPERLRPTPSPTPLRLPPAASLQRPQLETTTKRPCFLRPNQSRVRRIRSRAALLRRNLLHRSLHQTSLLLPRASSRPRNKLFSKRNPDLLLLRPSRPRNPLPSRSKTRTKMTKKTSRTTNPLPLPLLLPLRPERTRARLRLRECLS